MAKFLDLAGQRYGRLVVTGPYVDRHWTCRCDCGNTKAVFQSALRRGMTKSCGCLNSEKVAERNRTHGLTKRDNKPPEFTVWVNMRNRCQNPENIAYASYGGRGITVCERWASFEAFYEDMGPRPTPQHQIDRVDNDGPYAPENCRWADRHTQANNMGSNHRLTCSGETHTLADWARITGLKQETIRQRITKLKWDVQSALTTPPRPMRRRVKP